jgi:hypothetical protein
LDGFGKLYQEISGNPGPDPPLSTRKDVLMTDGGKKSKQVNLVRGSSGKKTPRTLETGVSKTGLDLVEVQGCQMV